jgi:hypothetical protein
MLGEMVDMSDIGNSVDATELARSFVDGGGSARGMLGGTVPEADQSEISVSVEVTDKKEADDVFKPEIVPPKSEQSVGHDEEFERLAYLRPRDTFIFIKQVPNANIDLRTEFRIIPAPRGCIRFTDDFRAVHQVPLDYALDIRIKLTVEIGADHNYPFYPGDKVKSKETGAIGEVIRAKANGYQVLYEETDGVMWMPPTGIRLIDKDVTTRNYIRDIPSEGFLIKFGDVEELRDTALAAMDFLRGANRPAFNRVSNMIAGEGLLRFPWIDRGILNFLVENDPRVWNKEKVSTLLSGQFDDKGE